MSRRGNCLDNAPMESFFASPKTKRVHQVRCCTREAAKTAVFEYIEIFYNRATCKTPARECQVCRFGSLRIGDLAWLFRYCLVFSGISAVLGHVGQADGGLASQW